MNGIWASYRKTALLTGGPPLVLSLAGLGYFGRLARAPLDSGAALVGKFQRGVSFLPRLTLGLGLSLTLGLISAIFYELQYFWLHLPSSSQVEFLLFFLGVMSVLVLGIFAAKLTAVIGKGSELRPAGPEPIAVLGRRVTVFEAPLLWDMVGSVAEKAGATPPDHLIMGLDGNFFATDAPVQLNWAEAPLAGRTWSGSPSAAWQPWSSRGLKTTARPLPGSARARRR